MKNPEFGVACGDFPLSFAQAQLVKRLGSYVRHGLLEAGVLMAEEHPAVTELINICARLREQLLENALGGGLLPTEQLMTSGWAKADYAVVVPRAQEQFEQLYLKCLPSGLDVPPPGSTADTLSKAPPDFSAFGDVLHQTYCLAVFNRRRAQQRLGTYLALLGLLGKVYPRSRVGLTASGDSLVLKELHSSITLFQMREFALGSLLGSAASDTVKKMAREMFAPENETLSWFSVDGQVPLKSMRESREALLKSIQEA